MTIRAMAGVLPSPRRHLTRTDDENVTWTARCPHGRDATWRAQRIENDWPSCGAHVIVSCPCTCPEPAP